MASGSWDEYFGTRKWRVATEVNGITGPGMVDADGSESVRVTFKNGRFEIEGGVFHSPLSSARGAKGVLLQEIDRQGTDIAGSRIAVGIVVFRNARREGAVV